MESPETVKAHVRRLTLYGGVAGVALQVLAVGSVWGEWSRVLSLVAASGALALAHYAISAKAAGTRGLEDAETVRIIPNVATLAVLGFATHWSLPALLYFPYVAVMLGGLQIRRWTMRFVLTIGSCCGLALAGGAEPRRVATYTGLAVFWHLMSKLHDRFASEMLTEREGHLEALSKAHRELSTAQAAAISSAKLASIGLLAAGVAHEINNPMSYVTSNVTGLVEDLAREPNLSPMMLEYRDEVLPGTVDGIRRVNGIVADLRRFARGEPSAPVQYNLLDEVAAAVRIAHSRLTCGQQVHTDFGPAPLLMGMPRQISQVALNLIVNAIEASGPKGQIYVSTRSSEGKVVLSVKDCGSGMSAETRANLFSPFFTTKAPGKGTGLGLAVSHGMIQAHGGQIVVTSALGEGTTFEVHLPGPNPLEAAQPSVAPA